LQLGQVLQVFELEALIAGLVIAWRGTFAQKN
jgi:hypothetical protein